jgi:hypothetical protein
MTIAKTATKIIDNQTVAAAGYKDASPGGDLSSCIALGVGVTLTFDASATKGARVDIFADPAGASASFTIGANDEPYDSADIALNKGNTVSAFLPLSHTPKFAKARIVNEDDSYSITACSMWAQIQTA